MYIVPMSTAINPLESVSQAFETNKTEETAAGEAVSAPSFMDVFSGIYNNAVEANAQKQ